MITFIDWTLIYPFVISWFSFDLWWLYCSFILTDCIVCLMYNDSLILLIVMCSYCILTDWTYWLIDNVNLLYIYWFYSLIDFWCAFILYLLIELIDWLTMCIYCSMTNCFDWMIDWLLELIVYWLISLISLIATCYHQEQETYMHIDFGWNTVNSTAYLYCHIYPLLIHI